MIRVLPVVLELAILVFCLIDCIQTDSSRVRNLPKTFWVLIIIVVPLIGGIAWFVAGRPTAEQPVRGRTSGYPAYERPRAPQGPDDDPDFLRQIRAVDDEHEKTLKKWEDDLRERERRLREDGPPDEPPTGGTPRA